MTTSLQPLFMFYDSEATGGNVYIDDIIEIAVQCLPSVQVPVFHSFIHTDKHLGRFAKRSGITAKKLKNKPCFADVLNKLLEWCDASVSYVNKKTELQHIPVLVAHNGLNYQFTLLFQEMESHGIQLDVFRQHNISFSDSYIWLLYQKKVLAHPFLVDTKSLSQESLLNDWFPGQFVEGLHSAKEDVRLLIRLLTESPLCQFLKDLPVFTPDECIQFYRDKVDRRTKKMTLQEQLEPVLNPVELVFAVKEFLKHGLTYDTLQQLYIDCTTPEHFKQELKHCKIKTSSANRIARHFDDIGLQQEGNIPQRPVAVLVHPPVMIQANPILAVIHEDSDIERETESVSQAVNCNSIHIQSDNHPDLNGAELSENELDFPLLHCHGIPHRIVPPPPETPSLIKMQHRSNLMDDDYEFQHHAGSKPRINWNAIKDRHRVDNYRKHGMKVGNKHNAWVDKKKGSNTVQCDIGSVQGVRQLEGKKSKEPKIGMMRNKEYVDRDMHGRNSRSGCHGSNQYRDKYGEKPHGRNSESVCHDNNQNYKGMVKNDARCKPRNDVSYQRKLHMKPHTRSEKGSSVQQNLGNRNVTEKVECVDLVKSKETQENQCIEQKKQENRERGVGRDTQRYACCEERWFEYESKQKKRFQSSNCWNRYSLIPAGMARPQGKVQIPGERRTWKGNPYGGQPPMVKESYTVGLTGHTGNSGKSQYKKDTDLKKICNVVPQPCSSKNVRKCDARISGGLQHSYKVIEDFGTKSDGISTQEEANLTQNKEMIGGRSEGQQCGGDIDDYGMKSGYVDTQGESNYSRHKNTNDLFVNESKDASVCNQNQKCLVFGVNETLRRPNDQDTQDCEFAQDQDCETIQMSEGTIGEFFHSRYDDTEKEELCHRNYDNMEKDINANNVEGDDYHELDFIQSTVEDNSDQTTEITKAIKVCTIESLECRESPSIDDNDDDDDGGDDDDDISKMNRSKDCTSQNSKTMTYTSQSSIRTLGNTSVSQDNDISSVTSDVKNSLFDKCEEAVPQRKVQNINNLTVPTDGQDSDISSVPTDVKNSLFNKCEEEAVVHCTGKNTNKLKVPSDGQDSNITSGTSAMKMTSFDKNGDAVLQCRRENTNKPTVPSDGQDNDIISVTSDIKMSSSDKCEESVLQYKGKNANKPTVPLDGQDSDITSMTSDIKMSLFDKCGDAVVQCRGENINDLTVPSANLQVDCQEGILSVTSNMEISPLDKNKVSIIQRSNEKDSIKSVVPTGMSEMDDQHTKEQHVCPSVCTEDSQGKPIRSFTSPNHQGYEEQESNHKITPQASRQIRHRANSEWRNNAARETHPYFPDGNKHGNHAGTKSEKWEHSDYRQISHGANSERRNDHAARETHPYSTRMEHQKYGYTARNKHGNHADTKSEKWEHSDYRKHGKCVEEWKNAGHRKHGKYTMQKYGYEKKLHNPLYSNESRIGYVNNQQKYVVRSQEKPISSGKDKHRTCCDDLRKGDYDHASVKPGKKGGHNDTRKCQSSRNDRQSGQSSTVDIDKVCNIMPSNQSDRSSPGIKPRSTDQDCSMNVTQSADDVTSCSRQWSRESLPKKKTSHGAKTKKKTGCGRKDWRCEDFDVSDLLPYKNDAVQLMLGEQNEKDVSSEVAIKYDELIFLYNGQYFDKK